MSDAGANDAVIFTQDELRQLCAEWQKILRLQDNEVKAKSKEANLDAPDVYLS